MTDYALGVDLGNEWSAAAVARGTRVEDGPRVASVVALTDDGTVLAGPAAELAVPTDPARTARAFLSRLGDATPLIVGGTPYGAEALTGHLLRSIVEEIASREGGAPEVIVLSHPASATEYEQWRALLHHFYDPFPVVEHYNRVLEA